MELQVAGSSPAGHAVLTNKRKVAEGLALCLLRVRIGRSPSATGEPQRVKIHLETGYDGIRYDIIDLLAPCRSALAGGGAKWVTNGAGLLKTCPGSTKWVWGHRICSKRSA